MHLFIILLTYLFHKYLLKSICELMYKCPFKLALVNKITETTFKAQYTAHDQSHRAFFVPAHTAHYVCYLKSHSSPVRGS